MVKENFILNIIIDCSGSMVESGKRLIARGIVRQIEQYLRFAYASAQIQLFAAKEQMQKIDWNPEQEYPETLWACAGSLGVELWRNISAQTEGKFLLLTDGAWSSKCKRAFCCWTEKLPPDSVRIIKIGNESMAKVLNVKIFRSEELFEALDQWLEEN